MARNQPRHPQTTSSPPQDLSRPEHTKPNITPPSEARTDPDRGVGEMGAEELDPDQPLNKPVEKQTRSEDR